MGGGAAEGGNVDAGSNAKAAVVGTGKVVGGVVAGGNGKADLGYSADSLRSMIESEEETTCSECCSMLSEQQRCLCHSPLL